MKNLNDKQKRTSRIRTKLLARSDRPRLTVNRSNKHIFAQIIDQSGKVLVAFGSEALKGFKGNKTESAAEVGKKLGEMAKEKKVITLVFDRGSYRFHGRVKALAEAVRSTGIKF
ncbi:MAG: 50S ribosomal protein L18 [Candidatus Collierbacteria bacterium GW2011_GWB1_44_6]|uniref:Large ribosomal subunit protein uL18 n=1 Tax=Candidatus Collierbacteria bacterium GW2011_GWB1_44_6 TaxID=1618384 RepID=A0A0G1MLX6_9BACT|nr:MAG: 50S ribosomal protein L18 [Candidatus Collierbacteria bacterium GW2011_GWB1_44_6]